MSLIDFFQQYSNEYIELVSRFFIWYNAIGRKILDILHNIFENAFDALLFIAILVSVLYFIMSLNTLFKKHKHKNEEYSDEQLPFITVQIPTFNELVAIRCAKSCLDFNYPKDRYEILIGDDSNKPEISKKLQSFTKEHDLVRVIKRKSNEGYKPGNLNNMLK